MTKQKKYNIILFAFAAVVLAFVGAGCEKKTAQPVSTQPTIPREKKIEDAVAPGQPAGEAEPVPQGAAMPIVPPPGQPPVVEKEVIKSDVVEVNLDARNFSFSQTELRVKKGDRVKVTINVVQGFHDWVVDEFNARTAQVGEGKTATVEFVADKVGTFEYYCSVGNHRALGMKGKLIVE